MLKMEEIREALYGFTENEKRKVSSVRLSAMCFESNKKHGKDGTEVAFPSSVPFIPNRSQSYSAVFLCKGLTKKLCNV